VFDLIDDFAEGKKESKKKEFNRRKVFSRRDFSSRDVREVSIILFAKGERCLLRSMRVIDV